MSTASILIVDTETTGLEANKDQILEVAIVHYDVRSASVVSSFATLVNAEANAAERVNRIPVDALRVSPCAQYAWNRLSEIVDYAGSEGGAVWMAHGADFDRGFLTAAAPRLAARLPWVCSMRDMEWPEPLPSASCVSLALAHGVAVTSAHRALTDAMLIAETLRAVQRGGTDVAHLVARALRPRMTLRALVTFDTNALAKAAGFTFHGEDKTWRKRVAIEDAPAFRESLPFKTIEIV